MSHIIHKLSQTDLYWVWAQIKSRCLRKTDKSYKNYGGRGISICNEWKNSFISFYNWSVQNGYTENKCTKSGRNILSIDRIDNDGDYCPQNCRWVNDKKQSRNRRSNRYFEYNNQKLCLSDWAKKMGMHEATLRTRLNKGWSLERALNTPPNQ